MRLFSRLGSCLTLFLVLGFAAEAAAQVQAQGLYQWSHFVGNDVSQSRADGTGADARLDSPDTVGMDAAGNLYVLEYGTAIRKITPTGVVTTLALAETDIVYPMGIAVAPDGTVYVSDSDEITFDDVVRVISPAGVVTDLNLVDDVGDPVTMNWLGTTASVDAAGNLWAVYDNRIVKVTPAGVFSFFAGTGAYGYEDGSAEVATFYEPWGVVMGSDGNLYVSDFETIRQVSPMGDVTTLAGEGYFSESLDGTGTAAHFQDLHGIATDGGDNLYVVEGPSWAGGTVRKVTLAGVVTTLAGEDTVQGFANGTGANALFREPDGIVAKADGTLFVCDTGNYTVRQITALGVVTTLAGRPPNFGSANGTGTAGLVQKYVAGVTTDAAGNIYVADQDNFTIRKITPAGVMTTVAGTAGAYGLVNAKGAAARFGYVTGIVCAKDGTLYVSDTGNHVIRKITTAGVVTTLAGTAGQQGGVDGAGAKARFRYPVGLAMDKAGAIYVADLGNAAIRKVTAGGAVTTFAGLPGVYGNRNGTKLEARFIGPNDVTVDTAGNVYVTDIYACLIRKITPAGVVSTLAGRYFDADYVDGDLEDARFHAPYGIAVDSEGTLFVSDGSYYGESYAPNSIRRISTNGQVTTIAGGNSVGNTSGLGSEALLNSPGGLTVAASGALYVAGGANGNIMRGLPLPDITITSYTGQVLSSGGAPIDLGSAAVGTPLSRTFTIQNPHKGALNITGAAYTGANASEFTVTLVGASTPLSKGQTRSLIITATPSVMGTRSATIEVLSDALGQSPFSIPVTIEGVAASVPVFVQHPESALALIGDLLTLSQSTSGPDLKTQQWLKGTAKIAKATDVGFSFSPLKAADAGIYKVAVTNATGTATSNDARIGVLTRLPETLNVSAGGIINLAVTPTVPTGASITGYVWSTGTGAITNGGRVSGQGTKALKITGALVGDTNTYRCLVTMTIPGGTVNCTTNECTVNVHQRPVLDALTLPDLMVSEVVPDDVQVTSSQMLASFAATGLPPGVVLNTTTGFFSGRPTAARIVKGAVVPYNLSITAKNAGGTSLPLKVDWLVNPLHPSLVGEFVGLVEPELFSGFEGGRIQVTVTAAGSCSATATLYGKPIRFSGIIDDPTEDYPGIRTQVLSTDLPSGVEIELSFDPTLGDMLITLYGLDQSGLGSGYYGGFAFRAKGSATAGNYNMRFAAPRGGYATCALTAKGAATFACRLPDGTAVTAGGVLNNIDRVPIHVLLYTNKGSVNSWLEFGGSEYEVEADLYWFKKPNAKDRLFPTGVATQIELLGNLWKAPVAPLLVGGLAVGTVAEPARPLTLSFSMTSLGDDFISAGLTMAAGNKPVLTTPIVNELKITTLTATTGVFSGSFTLVDPDPLKPLSTIKRVIPFQGLLVRPQVDPGLPDTEAPFGGGYFHVPAIPTVKGQTLTTTPLEAGSLLLSLDDVQ